MAMSPRLLRPRAAGGFNPKTISGLGLWLDASADSSLTFNANTVSEWRDLSGNARNFTQATAANQPSGTVTTQNGRRVLSFEHALGTASRLTGNAASLSIARNVGGLTFFGVAKSDVNDTLRPILSASVGTGTGARVSIGTAFTAPNNFTVGNRRLDADSSQAATAGSNNTNANVFGGVLDYANAAAYLHINGATVATNTSFQTAGNTSDTNSQAIKIGSDAGDVFNWRGWISEIIVYQRALSATERQRVERYLASKWGITLVPQVSNADAQSWIDRVYSNGGTVSTATAAAVNTFVEGCVSDGIWDAMKSVGLLCGASNLAGALTPLKGTAPTNFNFVSGDYDRKTGLVGNGINKYLNTNRNNNSDGQDDKHMAVFVSTATTSSASGNGTFATYIGVGDGSSGAYLILRSPNNSTSLLSRSHNGTGDNIASGGAATGLIGSSRSGSANYVFRHSGSNSTVTRASQSPFDGNITVSGSASTTAMNGRVAFYSIGSSINLAILDARVSALVTAIGATAS